MSHPPTAPHDESHDDAHEHATGIGVYMAVFLALCVLTGASFFTCSSYWPFTDTPAVGWAFMMAVSCTKAMLVILFFMHLLHEANWKYVLTLPCLFMSVFLTLSLVPDVGLRMRDMGYSAPTRERLLYAADPLPEEEEPNHGQGDHEAGQPLTPASDHAN